MRRLLPVLAALAFALVSLSTPTNAVAEDSPVLSRIVSSGKLRVGMSGNQPPLNFMSRDGKMTGLEVDLARALAGLLSVEPRIVKKPFGELLGALQKGEVDLVISGMTITPERNMKVAFVGPYLLSGKSILTKSSTLAAADEASDLDQAALTLAALAGSTSQRFVETLLPNAKLVTTPDYDSAVQMLLDDEVQAVVADYEICALTAFRYPEAGLVSLTRPLTIEPLGVAVAPGDPLLVNFLENTLAALEAADVLNLLRQRWLEQGDWVAQLP